jgi:transposase InsO family protein
VVSDNGTELTSTAILRWCQDSDIEWHYIAPGKPMQDWPALSRSPPDRHSEEAAAISKGWE